MDDYTKEFLKEFGRFFRLWVVLMFAALLGIFAIILIIQAII